MLVGSLFIISNYYLWSGMTRIPGAERYYKFIKYILFALIVSFAIWLTPHNLPLSGREVGEMGGSQYHPTLKFLGLMPAKNAVVNLIILATFFSFLLYRRGNKAGACIDPRAGRTAKIVIHRPAGSDRHRGAVRPEPCFEHGPGQLDLPADRAQYHADHRLSAGVRGVAGVIAIVLALVDRGKLGQALYLAVTAFNVAIFLGVYGSSSWNRPRRCCAMSPWRSSCNSSAA